MDGMKKEAELVRNLGFTGKGSIHPKQINILNEIFTPPKEEIDKAKKNYRSIQCIKYRFSCNRRETY